MLKKIRNRSPNPKQCEQMEFAKKLRMNINGNVHLHHPKRQSGLPESQKVLGQLFSKDCNNTAQNKKQYNLLTKQYSAPDEDYLPVQKRKKISNEFFDLVDESKKTHFFPMFKEANYSVFKHKCFIPVIELVRIKLKLLGYG